MEFTHQDHQMTLASIILLITGLVTEITRQITHNLVDNYDVYFKLLTLGTLTAALLTYLVKWGIGFFKLVKGFYKK